MQHASGNTQKRVLQLGRNASPDAACNMQHATHEMQNRDKTRNQWRQRAPLHDATHGIRDKPCSMSRATYQERPGFACQPPLHVQTASASGNVQHTTHDTRWHDCGCSASVHQFDRYEPSRQRYACAGQAEAQAGGHRWQSASKGSKSQLGNDLEGEREERDRRQKEKEEQRQGDLCTSREVDCNAQEIWWAAVNDKCHGPR